MALNGNSFAAKLHELEDEYRLLSLPRVKSPRNADKKGLFRLFCSSFPGGSVVCCG